MPDELPTLTTPEANAVMAFLTTEGSLYDVAAVVHKDVVELLEILARPHCRAYIDTARSLARKRADAHIAAAIPDAVDILKAIASNPDADPVERRRAAGQIIRAGTPRATRVQRSPHAPTNRTPSVSEGTTVARTPPVPDTTPPPEPTTSPTGRTAHEPRDQAPSAQQAGAVVAARDDHVPTPQTTPRRPAPHASEGIRPEFPPPADPPGISPIPARAHAPP